MKKTSILLSVALMFVSVMASAIERDGRIDSMQSRFMIKTGSSGLLKVLGHSHSIKVEKFSGNLQFSLPDNQQASLQMNVKSDSLVVMDKVKEKEKAEIEKNMKEDVLETEKFPNILFKSSRIETTAVDETHYKAKIVGNLNLHGVTKEVTIPATIEVTDKNLTAKGEFTVKQTDFGMKPISAVGGTIKVKNDVKIIFEIVAR